MSIGRPGDDSLVRGEQGEVVFHLIWRPVSKDMGRTLGYITLVDPTRRDHTAEASFLVAADGVFGVLGKEETFAVIRLRHPNLNMLSEG